jgi:Tol biopolymer transport system component
VARRTIIAWAGSASLFSGLWAGMGDFVTVAQRDALRSPRAPRTVDISADGRFVAFESWASLVPADDDRLLDIYVLDRETRRVTLESGGLSADCSYPRISGDGRFVVFEVRTLQALREGGLQIALRDRTAERTRILTGFGDGATPEGFSRNPDISDDGRMVVFSSAATQLTEGADANGRIEDVYAIDLATGVTRRVSVTAEGLHLAKGASILPAISGDGRWVAFASTALLDRPAHAPQATTRLVYARDLIAGTIVRVSRAARGATPDGDSTSPTTSGDGRFIAFASEGTNIVENDGNRGTDLFLFDRDTQQTILVSRAANGSVGSGISVNASISADGRYVAFQSDAGNLVCASRCPEADEDINLLWDTFVFDRVTSKTVRISEDELGGWMDWSAGIAIDGAGRVVAFSSRHPRDPSDRLQDVDLFVRTLRR